MRTVFTLAISLIALAAAPAQAATAFDPVGDFLPSYTGSKDADLDVTSFSVAFNSTTQVFTLGAVVAGVINPNVAGRYVIGVNTGTGPNAPFGAIGQPNVRFNQTLSIFKDGTGTVGNVAINPADIAIAGNQFTVRLAASLFPSTGFLPAVYGWNLWPRDGGTGVAAISDFAPDNALVQAVPAPEPATWMMMIAGFGLTGSALRRRRATLQTAG